MFWTVRETFQKIAPIHLTSMIIDNLLYLDLSEVFFAALAVKLLLV